MRQNKILLDVDGVQADFVTAYLGMLNLVTGRAHRYEDVTNWQFSKCVSSPEEDREVWGLIDRSPGLVRNLGWHDGAEKGVAALRALAPVRAVTSPHYGPHWVPERAHWLMDRGYAKRDIIFCSAKEDVPGTLLVEDRLANAVDWAQHHPNSLSILMNAPWNQGPLPGNVIRVRNWEIAVDVISGGFNFARAA